MNLIVGTRGSRLAQIQAQTVARCIESTHSDVKVRLEIIQTKGDTILDKPLHKIGGKGLFVKEIEKALLSGEIDLAVHSLKDMPSIQPKGLCVVPGPKRESPWDVLVFKKGLKHIRDLPTDAILGTGAIRRWSQMRHLRSDLSFVPIRGNIETRINKIESENLHGAILAQAAINRLNFKDRCIHKFSLEEMVPAPGQGALAIECRENDVRIKSILEKIAHEKTAWEVEAERTFLIEVDGGCHMPVGAYAQTDGVDMELTVFFGNETAERTHKDFWKGPRRESVQAARKLAERAKEVVYG